MYGSIYENLEMFEGRPVVRSAAQLEELSDERRTSIASDQFKRGLQAVTAENYIVAGKHFKAASMFKPHPATLWNIAKSSEQAAEKSYPNLMGSMHEAKRYYESYRDAVPASERTGEAAQVEQKIAEVERRLQDPGWDNRDFWKSATQRPTKSQRPRRKGRTGERKGRRKGKRKGKQDESWWAKNWWVPVGGVAALALIVILVGGGSPKPLSISPPQ